MAAAIKTLPSYARRYDPDRRVWTVLTDYIAGLEHLLRADGHRVIRCGSGSVPPPRRPQPAQSWADLLLDRIGPERQDRLVRRLSKVLHPDAGGDHDLMSELTAARERRR